MRKPGFAYIYALRDPRTNELRYVGKANDPKARLAQHRMAHKEWGTDSKRQWLIELRMLGKSPLLEILECVATDEWRAAERKWMASFAKKGCRLLNEEYVAHRSITLLRKGISRVFAYTRPRLVQYANLIS